MSLLKHGWVGILAAGCSASPAAPLPNGAAKDAAASGNQTAAPAVVPTDPARLAAADRAAIMQAAGYRLTRGDWSASCDAEGAEAAFGGEITQLVDLNRDGSPEAVVEGGNTYCFGMTGSAYAVLTRSAAGWSVLTEGVGIPGFYARPGLPWSDIEIGGPGVSCFPFERWNGREYVLGGTSVGGRICDLRVMSAAMPLPIGYYVQAPASCRELTEGITGGMIGYLGRDRWVQVSSGTFVSFRQTGPGRYSQTEAFPSEEEDGRLSEPVSNAFAVNSDSSFRLYDHEDWSYCPLDEVPREARFLDSPDFRNDPNIRAVRGR